MKKTKKIKNNKLGCSFFLIAIPLSLLLSFLLAAMLAFFAFRAGYSKWEADFDNGVMSSEIIKIEKGEPKSVEKKIKEFSGSNKKLDFIEITTDEFVQILGNMINENLPSSVRITDGYAATVEGAWKMYYRYQYKDAFSVWIVFDLNKDETEGIDLYTTDLKFGDISVIDLGGGSIISSINEGIRDSMALITQKDFTGRVIRNIELDADKMIIKGER